MKVVLVCWCHLLADCRKVDWVAYFVKTHKFKLFEASSYSKLVSERGEPT
jgi:hypothetical protein